MYNDTNDFLKSKKRHSVKLLKYFDDFGDFNSSFRIVNHLEKIA